VQIAFAVATHQLAVLGEGDIALDDAGSHARPGAVSHVGMLRELHGRAAVADGEVGAVERTVLALHQAVLELALIHTLHQVEGPRAELHAIVGMSAALGLRRGGN